MSPYNADILPVISQYPDALILKFSEELIIYGHPIRNGLYCLDIRRIQRTGAVGPSCLGAKQGRTNGREFDVVNDMDRLAENAGAQLDETART